MREQLPKYVSLAKNIDKPYAPTPKVSQSIDLSKFRSASIQKYKLDEDVRNAERKAVQDDYYFYKALGLQRQDNEIDELDKKIFMSSEFKNKINHLNAAHNEALSDFNQYFEVMTDLERSPFMPSHISKAYRAKIKQEKELAEQEKIKAKWE